MEPYDRIQRILGAKARRELSAEGLIPSAVLVPLFMKQGAVHLLMARRTDRVLAHKRQISFPGGVCDPGDQDLVDTALREAWEEVGLERNDVQVLGILGDISTMTGYLMTPVVGQIPYPYPFRISEAEVEGLLEVPWAVFSERRGYRCERTEHNGQSVEVDFYNFEGQIIWGATARIARQLVEQVEPVEATSRCVLEEA